MLRRILTFLMSPPSPTTTTTATSTTSHLHADYRINENLYILVTVPILTALIVGGVIFVLAQYSSRQESCAAGQEKKHDDLRASSNNNSTSDSSEVEYHPPYHGGIIHGDTATSMQYQRSMAYVPRHGRSDSISNSSNVLSNSADQAHSSYNEQDFDDDEEVQDGSNDDAVLSPMATPQRQSPSNDQLHAALDSSTLNLNNHVKTHELTDNDSKVASKSQQDTDADEYRQLTESLIRSIADEDTKPSDVLEALRDLQHLLTKCTQNQRYVSRTTIVNTIVNQHGLDVLQTLSTRSSEDDASEVATAAEQLLQQTVPLIWSH